MKTALNYVAQAQQCRIDELEQLHRICALMDVAGDLVHCLQSERGSSNVLLASKGVRFREKWIAFGANTDEASGRLHCWLDFNERSYDMVSSSRFLMRLALAIHGINDLPKLRQKILNQEISAAESTGIYSSVVNALLALVFEAADIAVDPSVSKGLVALFHLMQGKEFSGLERATGARICASEKSDELLQALGNLIELQEHCIERFEDFSSTDIVERWLAMTKSMPMIEFEKMRRKLLSPKLVDESIHADDWFSMCTRRIDAMHMVEKCLTNSLATKCDALIREAHAQLNDQNMLLSALSNDQPNSPISLLVSNLPSGRKGNRVLVDKIGSNLSMEILDVLQSQSKQLAAMGDELLAVRATIEERKVIERAKGMLMAHQGLSEEGAYSAMRDKAMSQNQKLIDVAKSILSLSEFLKLKH
jgi:hypothetical protein